MTLRLTDDGTLDTVVRCDDCGEELRYNFDPEGWEEVPDNEGRDDVPNKYDLFCGWAIQDATDQHVCAGDCYKGVASVTLIH